MAQICKTFVDAFKMTVARYNKICGAKYSFHVEKESDGKTVEAIVIQSDESYSHFSGTLLQDIVPLTSAFNLTFGVHLHKEYMYIRIH